MINHPEIYPRYKKSFRHSFIGDGREPILVAALTYMGPLEDLYWSLDQPIGDCCLRVLPPTNCAKASHAQLPNMPLRRDTQALRLVARIPLIQRREKCPSREEKSAFP